MRHSLSVVSKGRRGTTKPGRPGHCGPSEHNHRTRLSATYDRFGSALGRRNRRPASADLPMRTRVRPRLVPAQLRAPPENGPSQRRLRAPLSGPPRLFTGARDGPLLARLMPAFGRLCRRISHSGRWRDRLACQRWRLARCRLTPSSPESQCGGAGEPVVPDLCHGTERSSREFAAENP